MSVQESYVSRSGMTTRLTHRDYPQQSYSITAAPSSVLATSISSNHRSVSGSIYESESPLCGAPASSGLLDNSSGLYHPHTQHPQAAWTPANAFRSSPSTSSQSPPGDVAPSYEYIGAGGAEYVALSAMLSAASDGTDTVHIIPGKIFSVHIYL